MLLLRRAGCMHASTVCQFSLSSSPCVNTCCTVDVKNIKWCLLSLVSSECMCVGVYFLSSPVSHLSVLHLSSSLRSVVCCLSQASQKEKRERGEREQREDYSYFKHDLYIKVTDVTEFFFFPSSHPVCCWLIFFSLSFS